MKVGVIALAVGAVFAFSTAACSKNEDVNANPEAVAAPDTVTGVVRRIGNTPFVRTIVQNGDTVTVTGPYEKEIARLAGASVTVVGERTTGDLPGTYLDVRLYHIVSVDGEVPTVGYLGSDGRGFYLELEDGKQRRLEAVSEGLARNAGGKVWVVTAADGVVQRYGIITVPDEENAQDD